MQIFKGIKNLFAAIGLGIFFGSLLLYQNTSSFLAEASPATGKVIELHRFKSKNSDIHVYRPVIRFRTSTRKKIVFIASSGSNPPAYSKGEKLEVLYLPSRPREAIISGFFSVWGDTLILVIMGLAFSSISGLVFFCVRSREMKKTVSEEKRYSGHSQLSACRT